MKCLTLSILVLITFINSAGAALKPLPGTLEIACRQFRIKTSGERSTHYFRTTADMSKIKTAIENYKTGAAAPKGLQPLFDLSWSMAAKVSVSDCVQIRGDTSDFSGQYLLRVITMQNGKASFISDVVKGEALDEILYGAAR